MLDLTMPFPWKEVKSTRISRLLSDQLYNSKKRRDGSSLVVETGFPTSLIDLFIKNREKLKNSSKKWRETSLSVPSQNDFDAPAISESPILFLYRPPSPSRMNTQVIGGVPLNCSSPLRSDGGGAESKCCVEMVVDAKGVLLAAVKILLVAVLALGAKRLTVGITMSAFLLCFLECAGRYLRELLNPFSKAKGLLTSMVQRVPKLRYKDDRVDQKKGGASSWRERQEGYPITLINEIQPERETMEDSCFKGRNQENESNMMVIGKEESLFEVAKLTRKSRKDKIKSKMKLFVPAKLRKEHNFRRLKVVQVDKVTVGEEQGTDGCKDEMELETTSRLSSTSNGSFEEEEYINLIYAVGGLREIDEEVATNEEVEGKETESGISCSWSYLVLCLTVLIGLIGGRAFALLLTLSWFLVLKLSKTLYREVPMIKSFDDMPG